MEKKKKEKRTTNGIRAREWRPCSGAPTHRTLTIHAKYVEGPNWARLAVIFHSYSTRCCGCGCCCCYYCCRCCCCCRSMLLVSYSLLPVVVVVVSLSSSAFWSSFYFFLFLFISEHCFVTLFAVRRAHRTWNTFIFYVSVIWDLIVFGSRVSGESSLRSHWKSKAL